MVVTTVDCSTEGFESRKSGSFSEQMEALRACSDNVSGVQALQILDLGVRLEDPDALALYGQLYEGESIDLPISLDANPARAAEYYARAARAGHTEMAIPLARVCDQLSPDDNLLHESIHANFCPVEE